MFLIIGYYCTDSLPGISLSVTHPLFLDGVALKIILFAVFKLFYDDSVFVCERFCEDRLLSSVSGRFVLVLSARVSSFNNFRVFNNNANAATNRYYQNIKSRQFLRLIEDFLDRDDAQEFPQDCGHADAVNLDRLGRTKVRVESMSSNVEEGFAS